MTTPMVPLVAVLVVALAACTGTDPDATDRVEVALTAPVEDLGGATLREEVLERARQVCPGIHPQFVLFNTFAEAPGFAVYVQVGLKARPRFCESAPDCFFVPQPVAVVPGNAPSDLQVDVAALATAEDPCWGR